MSTAIDLAKQGRRNEIWTKYCGFLDLGLHEFMEIQERLLMEQIALIGSSEIGKKIMGEKAPTSLEEFRAKVPITTYEDYAPYLEEKREEVLPQEPYLWAHTSGRSGSLKWVPYTRQAYVRLGERVLAGVILAAARWKGDVRLDENDVLVYNTPPRPYISGVTLRALAEQFSFQFVPSLEETEEMTFQERIDRGFQTALITGIDILGSLSVVLVKMGERFAEGARTTQLSAQMLHPKASARLLRGLIRSKIEGRSMLPKDLWKLKALPSGGMDTSIYKDKITYYWGTAPYEQYGSTEEGAIATQAWNKKAMTFFPDGAFLEFVPEDEWNKWRRDLAYQPHSVLLNEVEPNKRYEVVLTNFYGKPLLRYRMHDVIEFTSLQDQETGIKLPQMVFVGRTSDLIDLAGFTGLIDEKTVWQAIVNSEIRYEEWAMRKEHVDSRAILHLYIEPKESVDKETVRTQVHESLKGLNPFYADYESLIDAQPLEVTILRTGSFQAYMKEKQAAGADLAHLKPPHMNASDADIRLLLQLGKQVD
jgi:hypothetical protein